MTTTTLCTIPEARSASARASYSTVATKPAGWHAALASNQMFVRHNGTDQPGGSGGSS